ncbi:hypothetical protein BVRB_9g203540 [Beta vulgaris subsp. vulgaris]|nr:hypothetical protein BVRB_9g203540 [Beta vulgaris subsp. vulgaris]
MSGRGRKLPSWMMKCTVTEQASSSERKEETNENGFVEPHSKAVEPQKKVEADETGVPLIENTCNVLKKCEAKTRKRKSNKLDEGQSERVQEDESCFIKPCEGTRSKSKPAEDQVDDFLESDIEKKSDGIVRKRVRHNAPRKKHTQSSTKKFHNVTAESSPSEDDLTVEDLVSIAEEYVKADREKEYEKSKNLELEPKTKPVLREDFQIGAEKVLTSRTEKRLITDQPLSSNSSLTKPLSGQGSIMNMSTTDDPARDMLELLLGRRLKKLENVERKTDAMTEKITQDYELSKRSQNDTLTEVAPVMKKKLSLRDKVAKFLDGIVE